MRQDARVLVLAGGLSYEREVSLRSGRRVADALSRANVHAELRDVDTNLLPDLIADPPDAVVFALHGGNGEDGSLRSVLDLIGIPYVGPDADAARRAWDKPTAKALLRDAGLPTPEWIALPRETFSDLGAAKLLDRIVDKLGVPLAVKPARGGSGLGVAVVRTAEELPAAMIGCFAYGDVALVEAFAPGKDIAVGVVDTGDGPRVFPAVEIEPSGDAYDFAARYNPGASTWHVPARLAPRVSEDVAAVATAAFRTLGLRDLSRIDMMVPQAGPPLVLEAKVVPGMTETSLLPMACEAAGHDLGELMAGLVDRAIARAK
ncbi:D-alanine--D-alanine ligase family protein [Stackebrandtia nassauensis]|uniref:D-alanine--D-alanine ligase n=1 Tax=Stackebrandtia nassauensis (strain DSM 44728 / CIP 108903 / NRRL B-16338 / NBRC 102104 / LLR-40K-21) TaxID=446470 RepID=D3Q5I2_STANL|nr:D-alanine--D-alanine ligase [Stackebrandtia nassauensis]ADD46042.1 D-alanine/D-alanine ligase [Stackebrandtia nassauensis DSM 44728]